MNDPVGVPVSQHAAFELLPDALPDVMPQKSVTADDNIFVSRPAGRHDQKHNQKNDQGGLGILAEETGLQSGDQHRNRGVIVLNVWEQRRVRCFLSLFKPAKSFLTSKCYTVLTLFSITVALFGGGVWTLADVPTHPGNAILDAFMSAVTLFFLVELLATLAVERKAYFWSFFFWMDFAGTFSMIFEITFLLPNLRSGNSDSDKSTVFLRTARAAKVGTRVGRLVKIVKCLSVVARRREHRRREKQAANHDLEAKVISERLAVVLSTRISCVVIFLTLVTPFLQIGQYPEADLSMRSWAGRLEESYSSAVEYSLAHPDKNSTRMFADMVEAFISFYHDLDYQPYNIVGFPENLVVDGREVHIPGSSLCMQSHINTPVRDENTYTEMVAHCKVQRYPCDTGDMPRLLFDFRRVYSLEVMSDFLLIVLVVVVMVSVSFDLSRTLSRLLVVPMERMLTLLHKYASNILNQVTAANHLPNGSDEEVAETDLLEDLIQKLAQVAQLSTQMELPPNMEDLDAEGRGVVMEMMHANLKLERRRTIRSAGVDRPVWKAGVSSKVAALSIDLHIVNSWELDVLELKTTDICEVVLHILFDSNVGGSISPRFATPTAWKLFLDAACTVYKNQPYHNFAHAVDVTHTVYQVLGLVEASRWLTGIDTYSLLVAAISHDLGHFGRTNPFLVETRHELALRYNDNSPLENMHCAMLFEFVSRPDLDVFALASQDDRKQGRKVCISTILHTDNIHHMEMVRDISTIYEVNFDTIEAAAVTLSSAERGDGYTKYLQDVLVRDSQTWMQLFLHLADVSNPLKPFKMCFAWAGRVLDEFFDQGDEERRLGLPVGMLNDRQKVNKPGSQHGFINFLVAPLVLSTVRLFPVLHCFSTQIAVNLKEWRNLWVEGTKPTEADIDKRDDEVENIRATAEKLVQRMKMVGQSTRERSNFHSQRSKSSWSVSLSDG